MSKPERISGIQCSICAATNVIDYFKKPIEYWACVWCGNVMQTPI